tara:strand:+ start:15276 stop:15962 length:687 start_codon:yes stop_codon:yes gene_type:complete
MSKKKRKVQKRTDNFKKAKRKKTVEVIDGVETDVITYNQYDDFVEDLHQSARKKDSECDVHIYLQRKKKGQWDVSEVWDGIHTGRHVAGVKSWKAAYYFANAWAQDICQSQWIDFVQIVPPAWLAIKNKWLRTTMDDIYVVTSDSDLMLKYAEAKHGSAKKRLTVAEVTRLMKKKDRQEDLGFLNGARIIHGEKVRTNKNWPQIGKKARAKGKQTKWFINQSVEEVLF